MNIVVTNRKALENFQANPELRYAVISITNPGEEEVKINIPGAEILRVVFDDIDYPIANQKAIMKEDAQKIADFSLYYWNKADCLIVQCEAGISRSAGIAAALAKYFNGNDNEYFVRSKYIPNRRVYRLVLNALYGDF